MDGDTIIKSELFMAIEDVLTDDMIDSYGGINGYFNAIKLLDGTVEFFEEEETVRKVNAELNIF